MEQMLDHKAGPRVGDEIKIKMREKLFINIIYIYYFFSKFCKSLDNLFCPKMS